MFSTAITLLTVSYLAADPAIPPPPTFPEPLTSFNLEAPRVVRPAAPTPTPSLLSDRLLELKLSLSGSSSGLSPFGGYEIDRGGVPVVASSTADGLEKAVQSSSRASVVAHAAEEDLSMSTNLIRASLALLVAGGGSQLASAVLIAKNGVRADNLFWGLSITAGVCYATGLALLVWATPMSRTGLGEVLNAIGLYNEDLVNGRLADQSNTQSLPPPST